MGASEPAGVAPSRRSARAMQWIMRMKINGQRATQKMRHRIFGRRTTVAPSHSNGTRHENMSTVVR